MGKGGRSDAKVAKGSEASFASTIGGWNNNVADGSAVAYEKPVKIAPISSFKKRSYTRAEVAQHNTPDDAWMILDDKVYNVSAFGRAHPGGKVIYSYAGQDGTDVFAAFHAKDTEKYLPSICIGDIKGDEVTDGLVKDFRAVSKEFHEQGLFDASATFYVRKIAEVLGLYMAAFALIAHYQSWSAVLIGSAILGLSWQQGGWLSHDFCHHQVFKNRRWNDVAGYLLGGVVDGFSVTWWKTKHNTHHATCNAVDENQQAMDPDIDTMPLIAWSNEMAATITNPAQKGLIRHQHILIFPILLLARISWLQQSFMVAFDSKLSASVRHKEFASIGLHYGLLFGMAFYFLPIAKAATFCFLAELVCGGLLALVFVQSHNGMEIYSDKKDFVESQVVSTRNIKGNPLVHWFMGGLSWQLEHHLFPQMPRHNLPKTLAPIRKIVEKHGLNYEECCMTDATSAVWKTLESVALTARAEVAA